MGKNTYRETSDNMDSLREKLKKRAIKAITKKKQPSPSEKKSINLKKKLNRGVVPDVAIMQDCRDCINHQTCEYDHDLSKCVYPTRTHRCKKCGVKVMYRYIEDKVWEYCPICIVRI